MTNPPKNLSGCTTTKADPPVTTTPTAAPKTAVDAKAGILRIEGMYDRAWVTYGESVQFVQFESTRVDAGYATDVRPGETSQQAFERCWRAARVMVDEKLDQLTEERKRK